MSTPVSHAPRAIVDLLAILNHAPIDNGEPWTGYDDTQGED